MVEKVIVIGAGIGGLSAGIYALFNGYDVEIYETSSHSGGLCATWQRNGYRIDGCIHFLFGSVPGTTLYDVWKELGVFEKVSYLYHPEYLTILSKRNQSIIIYKDAEKLRQHLTEISPLDYKFINRLCESIKKLAEMPTDTYRVPPELMNHNSSQEHLKLLAQYLPMIRELSSTTVGHFFSAFNSSLIKNGFFYILPPEFSLFALVWTFAQFHRGDGAWVRGGSVELVNALENKFKNAGGKIHYGKSVTKVLCQAGRAVAIRLDDGTETPADHYISAIDGHSALFNLIEDRYQSITLRNYYQQFEPISGITQVSLGLNVDLSEFPHHECIELVQPQIVAGYEISYCILRHYCDDRLMAPEGHSVITSLFHTSFEYWYALKDNPDLYRLEKKRFADLVKSVVFQRYRLSEGNIVCVDVATPVTHNRMTGVWRGAYNGWVHSPENALLTIPKTLPGIKNFYFAGQWVAPGGGLPLSAVSGRWAVQLLRNREGKEFYTSEGKHT